MSNNNVQNIDTILKEIKLIPSEKKIVNRFAANKENQMAGCSGRCASGVCRTLA